MIDILLLVLIILCFAVIAALVVWVNKQAHALNALGQRVWQLEQRTVAKTNDPVANFKCL